MRRKRGGVLVCRQLDLHRCHTVLALRSVIAEQATGPTRAAPVSSCWPSVRSWLRPDVIAITAGTAVRARANILAGARADQAHTFKPLIEPFVGSHNTVLSFRAQQGMPPTAAEGSGDKPTMHPNYMTITCASANWRR
jgi:hypothetical protein